MAMTDHQYLACTHARRTDDLPGELPVRTTSSTSRPPNTTTTTAYSALPAFSTNHSLGSSQHCDPNLLTPISSGAGSPPPRHKSQPTTRRHPPAIAPDHQSLTPPSTSKMYQWSNDYSMAAPDSQSASPLSMQPMSSQAHFPMGALSDASTEHHHHKEDIPDPPEPYWGSFGVSTTEPESVAAQAQNMHHHAYYIDDMQHQMGHVNQTLAPSALVKQEDPGLHLEIEMQQHHQHPHQHHQHMPHPVVQQHDGILDTSQDIGGVIQPGSPSPDDSNLEPDFASSYEIGASLKFRRNQQQQSTGNRIFRKPRIRGGARSVAATTTPRRDGAGSKTKQSASSRSAADKETKAKDDAVPNEPLQFKDGMPDADRFLFELRRKYDNNKGKGMWDPITREYNERFNTQFDRAALQMRISRAKSKYVQWGEKDDQRLIDAARQVERQYYRQVHLKFKELGGNPQADFNVGNVEMRMVELGLAEVFMEPWKGDSKMHTRRRRKLNERQRNSVATIKEEQLQDLGQELSFAPQHQAQAGYLTHHHHHYPQHLAIALDERSHMGSSHGPELPPHTRDQVLDEIDTRGYDVEDQETDSDVNCNDPFGMGGTDGGVHLGMLESGNAAPTLPSERVAKQACEDILRSNNKAGSVSRRAASRSKG